MTDDQKPQRKTPSEVRDVSPEDAKQAALEHASAVKHTMSTPGWKVVDGIFLGKVKELSNIHTVDGLADLEGRKQAVRTLMEIRNGLIGIVQALNDYKPPTPPTEQIIRTKSK